MIDISLHSPHVIAFWSPGPGEMLLLAVIALLLYGGNLPEVARSWGKTFSEFRRGLHGIQNDINDAIYAEPEQIEYRPEYDAATVDPDYPESDEGSSESLEDQVAESDASRRD